MTKTEALAKYLECNTNQIENGLGEEEIAFTFRNEEYLVLTDSEADSLAKEGALNSIWALKPSFLEDHMEDITPEMIRVVQEGCGDATPLLLKLLDDKDSFVEAAILAYGRGRFLAMYDFKQSEFTWNDKDGNAHCYYVYRTN